MCADGGEARWRSVSLGGGIYRTVPPCLRIAPIHHKVALVKILWRRHQNQFSFITTSSQLLCRAAFNAAYSHTGGQAREFVRSSGVSRVGLKGGFRTSQMYLVSGW